MTQPCRHSRARLRAAGDGPDEAAVGPH